MKKSSLFLGAVMLVVLGSVSACGQKGPLYIPPTNKPAAIQ
jgi:predicted small lipoprotein YifL